MKFEVGFGNRTEEAVIDESRTKVVFLMPNKVEHKGEEVDIIRTALENPIGACRLRDYDLTGKSIAIVTSDITRPMPTYKVMPYILDEIYAAGAEAENITLVFALGSHRPHTEEEMRHLAGERAWREIRCEDSDIRDYVHMGETQNGTPVDITRRVAEADFRLCIGNIEFHYFAGYSGGAKAILPGVATPATIQKNHSLMVDEDACAGEIEKNPIRMDIEEGAAICGVDYIFNVVLDEHKKIVHAVAGDVTEAHREGCRFLDELYQTKFEEKADIVIVSQGGAPKDLNLYQTQKALDNSKYAVKNGGIIILVGSCREGLGNKNFEEWMLTAKTPGELINRIGYDFQLGGHKAAAIAMVLSKAEIYLVSELDEEFVKSIFMKPFRTLQEALDAALEKKGADANVMIMPYGGSTLPKLKERQE